jgi:hypothetical protein
MNEKSINLARQKGTAKIHAKLFFFYLTKTCRDFVARMNKNLI